MAGTCDRHPLRRQTSRARSAPSGRTIVLSRTLASAHGRCFLPRESSGRMRQHSLRAQQKHELDGSWPVYRVTRNKTKNETDFKLRTRSRCRIQGRQCASVQMIESAAELLLGPRNWSCVRKSNQAFRVCHIFRASKFRSVSTNTLSVCRFLQSSASSLAITAGRGWTNGGDPAAFAPLHRSLFHFRESAQNRGCNSCDPFTPICIYIKRYILLF